MTNDYYKVGSHNVICDICGKKRKREQVKKTWDGFMACIVEKCWYPKHPNDYPRKIIQDGYPVADARPRPYVDSLPMIPLSQRGTGLYTWETANWDDPYWTWEDDKSTLINVPLIIK